MLDKFYDFCKERGDELINNCDWSTCAVGLFLVGRGIDVGRHLPLYDSTPEFYEQLLGIDVGGEEGKSVHNLYDVLNVGMCDKFSDIVRLIDNSKHRGGKLWLTK